MGTLWNPKPLQVFYWPKFVNISSSSALEPISCSYMRKIPDLEKKNLSWNNNTVTEMEDTIDIRDFFFFFFWIPGMEDMVV